jgi:U3 small nucleolar RNA-associated protein 4
VTEADRPSEPKWVLTTSRHLHSHDVRTLIVSPPYVPSQTRRAAVPTTTGTVPVLVSGGLDMSLAFIPASVSTGQDWRNPVSDAPIGFEETLHRRISHVPQRSPIVHLAPGKRLLVCRLDSSVAIWSLPSRRTPAASSLVNVDASKSGGEWIKVLEMELKVRVFSQY